MQVVKDGSGYSLFVKGFEIWISIPDNDANDANDAGLFMEISKGERVVDMHIDDALLDFSVDGHKLTLPTT